MLDLELNMALNKLAYEHVEIKHLPTLCRKIPACKSHVRTRKILIGPVYAGKIKITCN